VYTEVSTTDDGFVKLAFWAGPFKRVQAIAAALGVKSHLSKGHCVSHLQITSADRIPMALYLRVQEQFG
jgi:hypothetical protein